VTPPLGSVRTSALANYLGQGWSALVGIAFLPLYIDTLGVESYALVGFFAVLQAWMALLDLGLTPTLNREMARLRAGAHTAESIRDLLRSLEIACGTLTAATIASLWFAAPWLTSHWLHLQGLPAPVVISAVRLMAFVLAIRFFEQIYRGALQGSQDQVWLNATSAVLATLRWGGAYLVISQIVPTVEAFFIWQGAVSVVTTAILVHRTYGLLPHALRPGRFNRATLAEVHEFARGMFFSSLLAFLLTQSDKLAVSKLLPLGELGYYTLATTVAGGLMQLVVPLNTAIYPRLTVLASIGDEAALRRTYHDACESMAAIVIPPALLIAFFPDLVLWAWSGNRELVTQVAPLLRILALGQLANALVNIPYMLQLAHGWTGLAIRINCVAVVLFIPMVLWAVPRYGGIGAASVWLGLNVGYVAAGAFVMHQRLLRGAATRWYLDAVLKPLAAGALIACAIRWALPVGPSRPASAALAVGAGAIILMGTAVATPAIRRWVAAHFSSGLNGGFRRGPPLKTKLGADDGQKLGE
jgi:O-antigen/teichoic acid export membrane protein